MPFPTHPTPTREGTTSCQEHQHGAISRPSCFRLEAGTNQSWKINFTFHLLANCCLVGFFFLSQCVALGSDLLCHSSPGNLGQIHKAAAEMISSPHWDMGWFPALALFLLWDLHCVSVLSQNGQMLLDALKKQQKVE